MNTIIMDSCRLYMEYETPNPQDIFFADFFHKNMELEKRIYVYSNEAHKIESAIKDIMKQDSDT